MTPAEIRDVKPLRAKNLTMAERGRLGGLKGGRALAASRTPGQRSEFAANGAAVRWAGHEAKPKRVYKTSVEIRRNRKKFNEPMPWPEEKPDVFVRSDSPLSGLDAGASRGKWTQRKKQY